MKKIIILFFVIFFFFNMILVTMMNYNIIPSDIGIIHKYITNFHARSIFIFLASIIILIKLKEKQNTILYIFIVFFNDSIGNLFGWYAKNASYSIVWYDKLIHFTSNIFVTFVIHSLLNNIKCNKKIKILLTILIAFAISTIFGIYEYFSDIYLHTHMVDGMKDIIFDNIFDLSGSILGGIILYFFYSKFNQQN